MARWLVRRVRLAGATLLMATLVIGAIGMLWNPFDLLGRPRILGH